MWVWRFRFPAWLLQTGLVVAHRSTLRLCLASGELVLVGGHIQRKGCVREQGHTCTTNIHFPFPHDRDPQSTEVSCLLQDNCLYPLCTRDLSAGPLTVHLPTHTANHLASLYPSTLPSVHLPIHESILCPSIHPPLLPTIHLPSIQPSVCSPSIHPSMHLPINLSPMYPPFHLSAIHEPIHPSVHPSICASIHPCICLSAILYLSIHPSQSNSFHKALASRTNSPSSLIRSIGKSQLLSDYPDTE